LKSRPHAHHFFIFRGPSPRSGRAIRGRGGRGVATGAATQNAGPPRAERLGTGRWLAGGGARKAISRPLGEESGPGVGRRNEKKWRGSKKPRETTDVRGSVCEFALGWGNG